MDSRVWSGAAISCVHRARWERYHRQSSEANLYVSIPPGTPGCHRFEVDVWQA